MDRAEALETVLHAGDAPEWEIDRLKLAIAVIEEFGDRYRRVESMGSREGYDDMVNFVETVPNEHVRNRLEHSLHGSGVFRRFKEALKDSGGDPQLQRWYAFQQARRWERAVQWLKEEGVEPLVERDGLG